MGIYGRSTGRFVALWLVLVSPAASADAAVPAPPPAVAPAKPRFNGFELVLLTEGVLVVNAGMASMSPKAYGGIAILVTPLAFADSYHQNAADAWVGGVGMVSIGAYDINHYPDQNYSRKKVFEDNLVAWNVFALTMVSVDYFSRGATD